MNSNYPAQPTAQGLASLGRNQDTMLMHVTPNEVAGLQQLAMAQGGSLTINPHTGLPEAGFFNDNKPPGVVVPIPILVPLSYITLLPIVPLAVNLGK